ncbi:uncharacterized protein MELLADRAFT_109293 [Melampsora larici-populina 98AG31]|uniref:Stc1 domain-containing protein n=1 Tax=Melampsora larici-populina (strain 98AG31 / pathotype 3-4-7) TaxID=747676 RepID=F4RW04_MELLP|nr:uncharacterized protein MELLADRAFT_109293 [Melampsora larici-populina 98AG31]EGG03449.1 hypothetical protein MELLADRAFT_109293 [Melampsora larici-populina 98AG31]
MPAIRSSTSTSASTDTHRSYPHQDDRNRNRNQNRLFCTRCRLVKELDEFDGNQLVNRFGKNQIRSHKFKNYNVEEERLKSSIELDKKDKVWCKRCVPKQIEEFHCSDCQRTLPRAKFSQAQFKMNKTDDDRLCKDCANLITERIEAHRLGNHFEVEMIDEKLASISHESSETSNQSSSKEIVTLEDYDDDDEDE